MRSLVVFVAALALVVAAPSQSKRSIGHLAYAVPSASLVDASVVDAPVVAEVYSGHAVYAPTLYTSGSAVSHQSRVDVRTSPTVFTAPAVVETAPVVDARTVYSAPLYTAPAAVSHQSRYDVRTSPAVVSEHVVAAAVVPQQLVAAPAVVDARSFWTPSVYASAW